MDQGKFFKGYLPQTLLGSFLKTIDPYIASSNQNGYTEIAVSLWTSMDQLSSKCYFCFIGSCLLNVTCPCLDKREETEAVSRDRNSHIFMRKFQDEFNQHIFVKPRSTQKSKGKNTSFSLPNKSLNDLINSKQSPTISTSTKSKVTKPQQIASNVITVEPFKDPKVSVLGNTSTYIVNGLDYFQDYEFRVSVFTEKNEKSSC